MSELDVFCRKIKDIIEKKSKLNVEGAREVIKNLNDFLYTTYPDIGCFVALEKEFDYFSDFHKYWHQYHKEILDCQIDESKCAKVAESLHKIYQLTNGNAFAEVWDTCGLSDKDLCRIRLLTANQDFRGSLKFSKLAEVFSDDNYIFHEKNIKDDPEGFLKKIKVVNLSQNDKRIGYAQKIAEFLIKHQCEPIQLIEYYNGDVYELRKDLIASNSGYGNKKADMFIRDMIVLAIWKNVKGFDKINVASDVNTIKVALRTGIITTSIPLVSSFLDIFCSQYSYIDEMNASAWRKVWEIWRKKYPEDNIAGPCLLDYFVYNVVGKQFCKESLAVFKGDCGHVFRWHSVRNTTCQICNKEGRRGTNAYVIEKKVPCLDSEGEVAILQTDFVKKLPDRMKIKECPFIDICDKEKLFMPPKSISIMGQTGWNSAYSIRGQGGGGLMA